MILLLQTCKEPFTIIVALFPKITIIKRNRFWRLALQNLSSLYPNLNLFKFASHQGFNSIAGHVSLRVQGNHNTIGVYAAFGDAIAGR